MSRVKYKFTRMRPPTYKANGNPYIVPEKDRTEVQGTATWTGHREYRDPANPDLLCWIKEDITYVCDRTYQWVLREGPIHFAFDKEYEITETKGYKETQRTEFERSLEVGVSAGLPQLHLSVDVKAKLRVDQTMTTEWFEERKELVKFRMLATKSYADWYLLDNFHLHKRIDRSQWLPRDHCIDRSPPIYQESDFGSQLATFMDDYPADASLQMG
jgi:hypothetical protein